MKTRISTIPEAEAGAIAPRCGPSRRAMTMVEMLFAVLIIFLMMALLIGAIRIVTASAQDAAHRTAALSLKQGITHFKTEFGFIPPLVRDIVAANPGTAPPYNTGGDPVEVQGGRRRVQVFSTSQHRAFLGRVSEVWPPADLEADLRFSIYTLPFYLVGVLDEERGGSGPDSAMPVDGFQGPGFRKPQADGQFEFAGRRYEPFFDVGSGSTTIYTADPATSRVELRDRNGVAFRYYRWLAGDPAVTGSRPSMRERTGLPFMVIQWLPDEPVAQRFGSTPSETSPAEMAATFAIVGAGPNGVFGDEPLLPRDHPQWMSWQILGQRADLNFGAAPTEEEKLRIIEAAMADNIVEVGQ